MRASNAKKNLGRGVAIVGVAITAIGCGGSGSPIPEGSSAEQIEQTAAKYPSDPVVIADASERLIKLEQPERAWRVAEKALSLFPDSPAGSVPLHARLVIGRLCADYGDPNTAKALIKPAQSQAPNDPDFLFASGALAAREQRTRTAYDLFVQSANASKTDPIRYQRAGITAITAGLFPEAQSSLERAVELAPKSAIIQAAYSDALGRLHRYADAAPHAKAAADLEPNNIRYAILPAINAAAGARSDEDYHTAANMLETELVKHPDVERLRTDLAGLHMRFGNCIQAREIQREHLRRAPGDIDGWLMMVVLCHRLADSTAEAVAQREYDRIVGLVDEAHAAAQNARLKPTEVDSYIRLSMALHAVGRMQEAFEALNRAATMAPDNPKVRAMMERVQGARGRGGRADN